MTLELWSAVDRYIDDELALTDAVLAAALEANIEGGLPAIDVTASQGKLLYMFARLAEKGGPFDLCFIDADKVNNPNYFEWAIKLSRSGSVIIVDNVVREGGLADSTSLDEAIRASRKVTEMLGSDPRVDGTILQTVGTKGYDGFAIATVV